MRRLVLPIKFRIVTYATEWLAQTQLPVGIMLTRGARPTPACRRPLGSLPEHVGRTDS